jgi:hypothetical protein
MYLMSKKQTVLRALLYGTFSVLVVVLLVVKIFERDILGIATYTVLVYLYVLIWKDYHKAFKKRFYDRDYARVKEQLQQTLSELLPAEGQLVYNQEGKITLVHRGAMKFLKKEYYIVFMANVEMLYDDMAMRNLMVAHHSYIISDNTLYVKKSFDTIMTRVEDDEGFQAPPAPEKTSLMTYIRQSNKANRNIPEDLRYASPQELIDLGN